MDQHTQRTQDRKNQFKSSRGPNPTDKRFDRNLSIRKQKREDRLQTRRLKPTSKTPVDIALDSHQHAFNRWLPVLRDPSASRKDVFEALRVVSSFTDYPIPPARIIEAGLKPEHVTWVAPWVQSGKLEDQHIVSKAWAILANIASFQYGGDWGKILMDSKIIEMGIVHLRNNRDPAVVHLVVWTMCNLISFNPPVKQHFIDAGGIQGVVCAFREAYQVKSKRVLATIAWICANIFQSKHALKWELIKDLWPCVVELIKLGYVYDDDDVESTMIDSLYAMEGVACRGHIVYETLRSDVSFLDALVQLVYVKSDTLCSILMSTLATLSENYSIDHMLISDMIRHTSCKGSSNINTVQAFLAEMRNNISSRYEKIRNNAAFIMTNLAIHDRSMFVPMRDSKVIQSACLALTRPDHSVGVIYCIALINALTKVESSTTWDQRDALMIHLIQDTQCIQGLAMQSQRSMNPGCVIQVLQIIAEMLTWRMHSPEIQNRPVTYCDAMGLLEDHGTFDAIEELCNHGNKDIEELSHVIMDMYDDYQETMDVTFNTRETMDTDMGFAGGGFDQDPVIVADSFSQMPSQDSAKSFYSF